MASSAPQNAGGDGAGANGAGGEAGGDGPVRFDRFVESALYDPDSGFFATGGGAGRSGADFLTSPEVGPLFGAVVARFLDRRWHELGRPDPFVVVEAAAGRGALALAVLAASPECAPALRYLCVERSAALRERQREHLAIDPASEVLDGSLPGPLVGQLADVPDGPADGVVIANELLDNLAFRLLERTGEGWAEVHVAGWPPAAASGRSTRPSTGPSPGPLTGSSTGSDAVRPDPVEVLLPAEAGVAARADRLAPDAPVGARIPLQDDARAWLAHALGFVRRGSVLVVDYADTTASMARRPPGDWLRTYRSHGRGGPPTESPGSQDITCEVALDQLAEVVAPSSSSTQAEWLVEHGIDDLVDEGRRIWAERSGVGDLATMRARSRVAEAEALCDPDGLGAFAVLEWRRP